MKDLIYIFKQKENFVYEDIDMGWIGYQMREYLNVYKNSKVNYVYGIDVIEELRFYYKECIIRKKLFSLIGISFIVSYFNLMHDRLEYIKHNKINIDIRYIKSINKEINELKTILLKEKIRKLELKEEYTSTGIENIIDNYFIKIMDMNRIAFEFYIECFKNK